MQQIPMERKFKKFYIVRRSDGVKFAGLDSDYNPVFSNVGAHVFSKYMDAMTCRCTHLPKHGYYIRGEK